MDADWGAILFKNGTAETIPAGGLVEPDGTLTPEGVLVGRKPTRNGSLAVLVNDQAEVLAGQYGQCRPAVPWATLAVHADDTVLAADTLGSKSGDWYARKGFAGFRPIGPAYSGFVPAVADGGGGGPSDWDTYKVVSGKDCAYSIERQMPDPDGGCKWLSAGEEPVAGFRLPSVEIGVVPDIDPDQFVLARPKAHVPGEYEISPWGSVQKAWGCNEDGTPDLPFWCYPTAGHIMIGSCKFPVSWTEKEKVGIMSSGRDFRLDLKKVTVEDCDEPFPADGVCPLPPPPAPPP